MIIKRLSASFGRLTNETITLSDGLNIIEAPNECGKSTWCAFIKAMLYGIRTNDRDKTGYLSDKTRYRPWSGAPMAGAMDIDFNGSALTIERKTEGKQPMKSFSAVYTGTGTPFENLFSETAGETLTGVSEAVFERSAYVSQAGIKVAQTPELEKRISALVTTGDETISYTEADERLRLWHRKRRYNKSGVIPALEEKLTAINMKLSRIKAGLDEAASMRLETERLKKQQSALETELDAFDIYESLKTARRARMDLEAAKTRYHDVYKAVSFNGTVPDSSVLSAARGDLRSLESLRTLLLEERRHLKEAQERVALAENAKKVSPFDRPDAQAKAQRAAVLDTAAQKSAVNPLSLVSLLAFVAAVLLVIVNQGFLIPAIVVAAAGLVSLIWQVRRRAALKRELAQLLFDFGVDAVENLRVLGERHADIAAAVSAAQSDVRAAENSLAAAEASYKSRQEQLMTKLSDIAPQAGIDSAAQTLDRLDALLNKLMEARADIRAAESLLKTLTVTGTPEAPVSEDLPAPSRTRQEISADLNYITARLEKLTNRYNMALGEIRAIGDPVILGSEKITAEKALQEQKQQYDALSLAIETLKDANTELQTRFSPLLSDTAGQIIHRLTDGRYEKLTFDKALEAKAKTSEETVSRNVLTLSCGTADQIYLALRLAVCQLILPEENPCPIILDDALTNFDDVRAHLALDYLKALAQTRQILLFTCHAREADYLSDTGGAHILKLQERQ